MTTTTPARVRRPACIHPGCKRRPPRGADICQECDAELRLTGGEWVYDKVGIARWVTTKASAS